MRVPVVGAAELSSPTLDACATTAGAAVAALVSIGCSRHMCGVPKNTVAKPAATNASDRRAIRPIDVTFMDTQPLAKLLACQHPLDDLASFHSSLIIARFAPSGILLNCARSRSCETRISTKSAGSIAVIHRETKAFTREKLGSFCRPRPHRSKNLRLSSLRSKAWRLASFPLPLSQSDTRTAAVLVDELDAGHSEKGPSGI